MTTVGAATFAALRAHGMTTIFANPGATEIPFLNALPDDFAFVLALHEGSVVGLATGWAIAHERPALVNLHTTAGLGNAVGALATARVNRAPLVAIVGQQDRRHLTQEPFLTGRLRGLAGDYPVWTAEPPRPQDVPAAVVRAAHEARAHGGPALVIVPSGDWAEPADESVPLATPALVRHAARVDAGALDEVIDLVLSAARPALVTGAGAASPGAWAGLVPLAEKLGAPVWQESFGARPGFPQDHPLFAGHLPANRSGVRAALAGHDVVLAVGAPAFRQSPYEPGDLVGRGTRVAVITNDPDEAHRSPATVAMIGPVAAAAHELSRLLPVRTNPRPGATARAGSGTPAVGAAPAGGPLRATHVFAALATRLPHDVVLVEETPSTRPDLERMLPARTPLGFVSAAMGGLGFGLPAALGLRLALPDRPVVALLGDGSSMYGIQALWSAAHYRIGALLIVLANGRYAALDRLAERVPGKPPWPAFTEVSVAGMARAMGCPAQVVTTHAELVAALDAVVPGLAGRRDPLLLEVQVEPDQSYQP